MAEYPDSVASPYRGHRGAAYFAYQARTASREATALDEFKYAPFVSPTDAVVDFGCGIGALLERLDAADKTGVEVSDVARRAARARGLRVVASTGELADASADVVISNHALEHVLSPLEELRELRRVLRTAGKLVVWLPIDDWRTQRRPRADPNHHLYTWTPLLLSNLLEEAGFEVRECRVVTHAWPPFTSALARFPRPIFDVIAGIWAFLRRRRQLMAVALPRP
jgi:SAM-dependent methyltransferase